jgi:uncharacterized membrane protein YphA (DoxX/SURF4 family)
MDYIDPTLAFSIGALIVGPLFILIGLWARSRSKAQTRGSGEVLAGCLVLVGAVVTAAAALFLIHSFMK